MSSPRFLVGIDLGTTNTVVAFCELSDALEQAPIEIFPVDQLIGPGEVVRRPLLPSFRYHPSHGQFTDSDLTLPWSSELVEGDLPQVIIGEWARDLGAKVEGRESPVPKAGCHTLMSIVLSRFCLGQVPAMLKKYHRLSPAPATSTIFAKRGIIAIR